MLPISLKEIHIKQNRMGFGFNLFFIIILIPLSIILLMSWGVSRKKIFGKTLSSIWIVVIGLVLLVSLIKFISSLNELDKDDIYGEYVIDRTKYSGKQSDWQYEHFRFEINQKNEILFHVTEKEKILKTYKGKIKFLEQYKTPRIVLDFKGSKHHIVNENPTLYRNEKSFYYVFYSSKFGNVFFTKGKWREIGS